MVTHLVDEGILVVMAREEHCLMSPHGEVRILQKMGSRAGLIAVKSRYVSSLDDNIEVKCGTHLNIFDDVVPKNDLVQRVQLCLVLRCDIHENKLREGQKILIGRKATDPSSASD